MMMDRIHLFFYKKMMTKIKQLEKQIEILWSYIPESDYELNEKISKEINKLEEE